MSKDNGGTPGKSLTVQVSDLRAELLANRETIFAAAASHIKPERFLELVARNCIATPKLLQCSRVSLFQSAAEAARIGLELGGVLGQAYLVPYAGEATLVLGYKGYKELAYRSDRVAVIDGSVVRPGDFFEWMKGTSQFIKHKPSDEAQSAWTHAYAFAKTTHGEPICEVMSLAQVERHRDKHAKGWNRADSAWKTNPEAMGIKTCLRRVAKFLPLSPEIQQLVEREEYIDHNVALNAPSLLSGEAPPTDDLDDLKGELAKDGDDENSGEPTPEELRRDGLLI